MPRVWSLAVFSSLILTITTLFTSTAFSDSAVWLTTALNNDWNAATNWNPSTIPNGPADIATFGTSNITAVAISANTEVDQINFNQFASAFTITASPSTSLSITGSGVTNNAGTSQTFVTAVDNVHQSG